MTPPTVTNGQVADELFEAVAPLAYDDATNDNATLGLVNALALVLDDIATIVNPADGSAPWSLVYDLDNAPVEWLPWLGQWVGVRIPTGLDEASMRLRVRETDGFKRGSVGAIMGAARQRLIGDRKVVLRERYDPSDPLVDSPYHLTVFTFTDETPDSAAVEAALVAQKPAGIILHYEVRDGQDWQTLSAGGTTWADVVSTYDDWADVIGTY